MTFSSTATITLNNYTTTNGTNGTTNGWYDLGTVGSGSFQREEVTDEQHRERREQAEERRRQHREAEERAEALLLSFLSEEQQHSYHGGQWFEVVGSAGGRYRIRQGVVGNVDWLNEYGAAGGSLCCHPIAGLPIPDVMLAQMLALITDEEAFVRLSNRYSGARHPLRVGADA